jgi:hypothetical protein
MGATKRSFENWSAVNIAKVKRLRAEGRMTPAGEEAFVLRAEAKSAVDAHEQALPVEPPGSRSDCQTRTGLAPAADAGKKPANLSTSLWMADPMRRFTLPASGRGSRARPCEEAHHALEKSPARSTEMARNAS